MELKATSMGKRLAQHPYNRVRLLPAGVEVSGDRHEYIIPFNQLLGIQCKRGVVWGELEFQLPEDKVVRLHGTEWQETQQFYHYLLQSWHQWSQQMAEVCYQVLSELQHYLLSQVQRDSWLTRSDIRGFREKIEQKFSALPLPHERIPEFDQCQPLWLFCQSWLKSTEQQRSERNRQWTEEILERYRDFFNTVESSPLNPAQCRAVINGEDNLLVLAGAGSGKTSVLAARAAWLIKRKLASADQILLLAFGRDAADEMNKRVIKSTGEANVTARTFHSLALHIIQQSSNKQPKISQLETDADFRRKMLTDVWQQQCAEKKSFANGWRQWLQEELKWELPSDTFWQDEKLLSRVSGRLERWVSLMRNHGGAQAAMIDESPEDIRLLFGKRIRLLAPLMKAWKSHLKQESALDFAGLIQQAVALLDKGRFISPWKYILVDEFQDISVQRSSLIKALRDQNKRCSLFAVGDDWQAIYRFAGAEINLTTRFHQQFGEGDICILDTTYRFNQQIGQIANRFIQQNPLQMKKNLNSLIKGNKKSVSLLAEDQLEALLNKMSGYVKDDETVLILARYHYLRPPVLAKAATRWPKLSVSFMTMHASKGQEADYVIVIGLNEGSSGFPAVARESVIEQGLLPKPEDFPDAEERRLAYVAMTRARQQLWLLYDKASPSSFVENFRDLGVPVVRKP
ncbi:DNA helicase IV [Tatumella morbirosei]|uniref:DNA 3'-5' helicase n=1 Tax=Tatumella morbirosei TaxID=642227 RepID=A0A095TA88_9GAMM|nr:DNA helicase IV [Tatumella morbirosei]KGD73597.1 DNA helicase IV [Tatumella morbirosei]